MTTAKLSDVFHSDPEIMGGTPVFTGTRVPVQNLVDYLEGGETIEEFLAGFPTVRRERVIGFIEGVSCGSHDRLFSVDRDRSFKGDPFEQEYQWKGDETQQTQPTKVIHEREQV